MYKSDDIFLAIDLMYVIYFVWGLSMIWRETLHKPVITSLLPCNTILSSLVTTMIYWSKIASHTESHNFPMDMRELCYRPDKMWASLESSGSIYKANEHPFVDFSIWPFDCFALIGDV